MKAAGGRQYSKRLGTLFPDQLQTALDHFGLGTLLRAEPVTLGLFGQNVFLMTDNGEYVLRGAPHYAWQFPKERFFARLLHENTSVPVPWPYLIDYSDGIFGWSYAIMPRLAGLQLIDPQFQERQSPEDRFGIACAMGETLACMHTLTWSHCGEYNADSDDIQPLDVTFAEWIVARVREYLELAIPHSDRTTEVDVRWVEDLIAQATDALQVPFEPCFVMHDFKEGNAVAKRIQGTWRISGVFDLMEPYFGDGEADLSRSVAVYAAKDPALARAFVQAYLKQSLAYGNPRRYGFAERFPIYMLLDRLIIWQYGQRHGVWWDPGLTLREWASPFTSLTVV
jgi:hygromycin-B 7''-O-kinase